MRPPRGELHLRLVLIWLGLTSLALQPPALAQANPVAGELRLGGKVTAEDGRALPGLRVILEASNREFDFRSLHRVKRNTFRQSDETDQNGTFELRWNRDSHFNYFELLIGMNVRVPEGTQFYTLERVPLAIDLSAEGPFEVDITVADTAFLERYRSFIAALDTDDERQTFDRMGIPAKIDRLRLATHEETTWWYFEVGKGFRFRSGRLAETFDFEPVTPFESEN